MGKILRVFLLESFFICASSIQTSVVACLLSITYFVRHTVWLCANVKLLLMSHYVFFGTLAVGTVFSMETEKARALWFL